MLSLIAVIGIVITYDFDFSFAFHRPGTGYTIIGNRLYESNGTDITLGSLFVQPEQNGTAATFANPLIPQPMNRSSTFVNIPVPQSMNGTQNLTSSSSPSTGEAAAAGQNQTMSQNAQALMALDIPELKENLMNVKEAIANGEREDALTGITDVENQLLLLQNKTTFEGNIQNIKDSISKSDLKKAIDDITKIQSEIIKAETEIFKAELTNPQLMQQNEDDGDGGDNN